jgi:hypothetical protein
MSTESLRNICTSANVIPSTRLCSKSHIIRCEGIFGSISKLPHPPYSTDLALYNLFLFPKLKTHLKGHHFGTVENVQAMRDLNNISNEDFLHCYEEWQ